MGVCLMCQLVVVAAILAEKMVSSKEFKISPVESSAQEVAHHLGFLHRTSFKLFGGIII